jgi:phenylpyruvate tautomerase
MGSPDGLTDPHPGARHLQTMPLIQLFTSASASDPQTEQELLNTLGQLISHTFGKPQRWAMTCLMPRLTMTFGGSSAPACFVNVRNVGTMTRDQTAELSREICTHITSALGVPADRVFIEFGDAVDYLWGWNGETFG